MKINEEISVFSSFLNSTFNELLKFTKILEDNNPILADKITRGYLQFIWEIYVESITCKKFGTLQYYGEGADFYEKSYRITSKDSVATNKINVRVNQSLELIQSIIVRNTDFEFVELVSFIDGKFYIEPPFNFVLCENEENIQFIFELEEIDLFVVPIA